MEQSLLYEQFNCRSGIRNGGRDRRSRDRHVDSGEQISENWTEGGREGDGGVKTREDGGGQTERKELSLLSVLSIQVVYCKCTNYMFYVGWL